LTAAAAGAVTSRPIAFVGPAVGSYALCTNALPQLPVRVPHMHRVLRVIDVPLFHTLSCISCRPQCALMLVVVEACLAVVVPTTYYSLTSLCSSGVSRAERLLWLISGNAAAMAGGSGVLLSLH